MIKITNAGSAPRGLPVTSTKRIVEIAPGASLEMSPADWAAIKDRASVKAGIDAKTLVIDGEAPAAPATDGKAKGGKKADTATGEAA